MHKVEKVALNRRSMKSMTHRYQAQVIDSNLMLVIGSPRQMKSRQFRKIRELMMATNLKGLTPPIKVRTLLKVELIPLINRDKKRIG